MMAKFVRKEPANKHDAVTFYFSVDHTLNYTAGQFTELTLDKVGRHWFTLSSAPGKAEFTITTRLTGSDFKNALDSLKPGDEIYAADSMGDFVLPIDSSRPILMVAGGIGITPFYSILQDLHKKNSSLYKLHLLYIASSKEDFLDLSKYKDLLVSYKEIIGRVESSDILKDASALSDPYIYTSGPEPMVEKIVSDLKAAGIPEDSLVSDYFPGYSYE
ncbi:MAG: FAD-dependent oxidoreductase [Candidatus Saccharibacteria bacterium]